MGILNRQLNEEETRVYAAGMAARRRGENKPRERVPEHLYQFWRAGWKRAGSYLRSGPINRAINSSTHAQSPHMVRTEVETLEQAVDVLAIQQRRKKAVTTLKSQLRTPRQQRSDIRIAVLGHQRRVNRAAEVAIQQDKASEFELLQVQRIAKAIEILSFSVDEMSAMSAMQSWYPLITASSLIGVIEKLCNMIKRPLPTFDGLRKPIQHSHTRRCLNCGVELRPREIEYCLHCTPVDDSVKISSELRREHLARLSGLKSEAKELGRLINDLERAVDHDDQRHGGHPAAATTSVEASGREEDLDSRSTAPHRTGTRDS